MRVFLAGATGVVGRRLVRLLREAKHEVSGTTRTLAKAALLRALDVTPVVVDVFEPEALVQASRRRGPMLLSISSPTCRVRQARPAMRRRRKPIAVCVSRAREI
jgi:uncharacterized protein YbjT (DUF2867 family)